MDYTDFVKNKIPSVTKSGFLISDCDINPALKPHQRDAVKWAVHGGRRALFESFGLGKTAQQLEFCRIVTERKGGRALIVLPLGVKQEFARDAVNLLGWDTPPPYVKNMAEIESSDRSMFLTNYERVRDGDIDPKYFTAAALDEASVLRGYGTKTYQTLLPKFNGVPYKLVSTATPSPNRYKELIHYAGYLEVMDTGQALTRFFQRDSEKAGNLTLYPHKESEFWYWVSSWALFITKPSDLGYDDAGYDMPELTVRYHKLSIGAKEPIIDRDGQVKLMREASVSLKDAAAEKSESICARVERAARIVNENPDEHFILWHDREEERRAIKKALPEVVEIYGSQDIETREQNTIEFSEGRVRLLATKKSLSGSGCNFQYHCHRAIFVGIDYEFNDFIQAIHRIYRFLQNKEVTIDIIYTEAEEEILKALLEKWRQHNYMTDKMKDIIKENGLLGTSVMEKLKREIGVKRECVSGERFTAINNDCVLELERAGDNMFDLIHTSIPFGNHYEYTPNYNDFGHTDNNAHFWEQMDYLTPHLLRALKPGRIAAIHVKDRILFGNTTGDGMPTCDCFHEETSLHFQKHGFKKIGMITIETDVVRENNQTYRLGWTEQCKDGSKMGVGCPEYILLFRKLPTDTSTAYADIPVEKTKAEYPLSRWQIDAAGKWRSSGDRFLSEREIKTFPIARIQKAFKKYSAGNIYDYNEHLKIAEELDKNKKMSKTFATIPAAAWREDIWDDIVRMRTLNTTQSRRRQQLHVCPLQIDIVDRIIARYSNPGELVLDPFAGLFTVPVRAVKSGRRGYGIELNTDYFNDGVKYLSAAEDEIDAPTLFDFIGEEEVKTMLSGMVH